MKTLLVFLALISSPLARADWFCTTQGSERRGQSIVACGKGDSTGAAFQAALTEFHRVCDASIDCVGHAVVVTPKRVTRSKNGTFTRMISVEILESKMEIGRATDSTDSDNSWRKEEEEDDKASLSAFIRDEAYRKAHAPCFIPDSNW